MKQLFSYPNFIFFNANHGAAASEMLSELQCFPTGKPLHLPRPVRLDMEGAPGSLLGVGLLGQAVEPISGVTMLRDRCLVEPTRTKPTCCEMACGGTCSCQQTRRYWYCTPKSHRSHTATKKG